jgi:hypothetical protein
VRSRLEFVTDDVWGRARDASLWIDVPAQMVRLGLPTESRALRILVARESIRQLRERLLDRCLIVAKLNGLGQVGH